MSYKLTILGYPLLYDGTPMRGPDDIDCSLHFFTYWLVEGFKALGVEPTVLDVRRVGKRDPFHSCDVLLLHTLFDEFDRHIKYYFDSFRKSSKVMALWLEMPLEGYSFDRQYLYFPPPVPDPSYKIVWAPCRFPQETCKAKDPRSVLLDHLWPGHVGTPHEWSHDLLAALEPYKDTFRFGKMLLHGDPASSLPSWVEPFPYRGYASYMKATEEWATFMTTHTGSYNSTVIDMLSRGTRVITKTGAIPQANVERFGVPCFNTVQEMASYIVSHPYAEAEWAPRKALCTDIFDAARMMDQDFKALLEGR